MVTGAWSPVIDPGSGDRCKSITKYDRLFTRNKQWFQQLGVTSENDLPATEFGVVGIDSTGVGRCKTTVSYYHHYYFFFYHYCYLDLFIHFFASFTVEELIKLMADRHANIEQLFQVK